MPSYQNVDVFVKDSVTGAPVEGMLVRVFDEANTLLYNEATSDATGRASFTLYTRTYNLRFYKFQTPVKQPQLIEVLEGPNGEQVSNEFQVYANNVARPVALDPFLSRASGFFRDLSGQPYRHLDIIFIGSFGPILLDNSGVLPEKRMVRTDAWGFACIDLIRCAKYSVTVESLEDQLLEVSVPDAPSVDLPSLLFPHVSSVSFAEQVPQQLSVGSALSLTPSVLTSTGVLLEGTANGDVRWSISDPTVAALSSTSTQLELRGLKAGTIELRAERIARTPVVLPFDQYIPGSTFEISVG